jgi:hypothetical protein
MADFIGEVLGNLIGDAIVGTFGLVGRLTGGAISKVKRIYKND